MILPHTMMLYTVNFLTPYRRFFLYLVTCCLFLVLLSPSSAYSNTNLVPQVLETPKGYSFWYLQTPNSPVTSLVVHYPASYFGLPVMDDIPNRAIANIAEDLFVQRNQRFNAKEIARILEQNNASITMSATSRGVKLAMSFITTTKDELSLLYRASIHEPLFAPDDLAFAKRLSVNHLEQQLKKPDFRLFRAFRSEMLGDSLWGRASFITPAHIQAITVPHLLDFHRHWQQTQPWVVALTSMNANNAAAYIDDILHHDASSRSKESTPPVAKVNIKAFGKQLSLQDNSLEQATIMIAMPSLAREHPDYYALLVLTKILREEYLYPIIRRQKGLAYAVHSYILTYPNTGFVFVETATSHQQASEVIVILKDTIAQIKKTPIEQKVIDKTVAGLINSSTLGLDTNARIASRFYNLRLNKEKPDTLINLEQVFARITSEKLYQLSRDLWQNVTPFVSIIGP